MRKSSLLDIVVAVRLNEPSGLLSVRLVFVQHRRVHAMEVELQNRLLVKEEKLKQVKAILMESQTLSPRQHHMHYSSSDEVLCEKSPASLSLFCVCS